MAAKRKYAVKASDWAVAPNLPNPARKAPAKKAAPKKTARKVSPKLADPKAVAHALLLGQLKEAVDKTASGRWVHVSQTDREQRTIALDHAVSLAKIRPGSTETIVNDAKQFLAFLTGGPN